jgi:hypothetical protein
VRERHQIRGYGLVWELKAKVQHVPGKHGNVPLWFPIAVEAIAYFGVVVLMVAILRHIPGLDLITGRPPMLVAYVLFPAMCAFLLTTLEPHGRSAARHLAAVLLDRITPRERHLGRPVRPAGRPAVIDGVTAIARTPAASPSPHGHIRGPARVEFRDPVAVVVARRGRRAIARRHETAPESRPVRRVHLEEGERLTTRL